jgi:hypothetical protein
MSSSRLSISRVMSSSYMLTSFTVARASFGYRPVVVAVHSLPATTDDRTLCLRRSATAVAGIILCPLLVGHVPPVFWIGVHGTNLAQRINACQDLRRNNCPRP